MNVLFISRATLFTDSGGDTIQLVNTARELRKLGVQVDIKLSNDTIDYSGYDLLHFFNIIRPADILFHAEKAGLPYVVSSIFVDYTEFDRQRKGLPGLLFKWLSTDSIEYIKVLARAILGKEKIVSPQYVWLGHRRAVQKVIANAAVLLPNSESEYERLVAAYKVRQQYRVVPNAIDETLFKPSVHLPKDPALVLCVGRVEGRKNQLNLVRALNHSGYRLVIIGAPAVNQPDYYQKCREEAGPNIQFIQKMPQEELVKFYQQAKVHVLPSWFETTGLSSLEAAGMGCNIVITAKGDTREYFEDQAFYCDPLSPASIREAVEKAAIAPFNVDLQQKIFTQYTWPVAAAQTLEAYNLALSHK